MGLKIMAGRLHIYYSQNKNFFRATFHQKCAKSGHFLSRKTFESSRKTLLNRAKTLLNRAKLYESRKTFICAKYPRAWPLSLCLFLTSPLISVV
jgi:dihydrofolate reductase